MAEAVERVSVAAYTPPDQPLFEDGVEYLVDAPNVSHVSLGPKGSWRDYRSRRRRVTEIVHRESGTWDVLVFYFMPNRRAHLVYKTSLCPRVVAFVVGTTAPGTLPVGTTPARRLASVFTRWWSEHQQREVLERAGLVVINSEDLRTSTAAHTTDVKVVPLSSRRERHVFQTADRFTERSVNLMIAGRITLEKGVIDAVDAFAIVNRSIPHARLHVVGEGPALEAMLRRAAELGVQEHLVMHGWIRSGDELFGLFRDMDALLLPSSADYEGFPQVIWEAMAHSVPVICTPVRGTDVLRNGRDVLFVPMREPTSMAEAVLRLANEPDLRRKLIDSGFGLAHQTSMDRTVSDILVAIREMWPELAKR